MANQLDSGMKTILASVIDGRTENVRYRQNELYRLYNGLKGKSDEIRLAISQSGSYSTKDAETEFVLAMDALRQAYEALDFEKSIKEEYLVAHGVDNSKRRFGLGLVAIRPSEHSRFYSVISPLAAAISAGNCVLVELKSPQSPIDKILTSTLSHLLDHDAYFISTSPLGADHLSKINFLVDQTIHNVPGSPRSIAVIDRSANLDQAAKAIVSARLTLNGASPYAPDLVLVNDFITEEFVKSCSKHAQALGGQNVGADTKPTLPQSIKEAKTTGKVKDHTVAGLTIIEITDPNFLPLEVKINGPYILTLPSTGLVAAVSSLRNQPTFLATYVFSTPKAAKYLCEQISSRVSYINQIPSSLLVGPPSAEEYPHQMHPRYAPEMFSQLRPQLVVPVKEPIISKEIKDIKPTGQKPGHALGFFEQGLITGLSITAFIVLPSLAYCFFRAGKEVWRYSMRPSTL